MSLLHLALAFVLSHPAVTSAIIGPRTMEQLMAQLGANDLILDPDILDQIDQIVPPGTNISSEDPGYVPPALAHPPLPVGGGQCEPGSHLTCTIECNIVAPARQGEEVCS
jgi:hypothetical protein